MPRLFERVAIAGVGLIGGSLALAARRAALVGEVVGLGRTRPNLDIALRRGIVDRVTHDPQEAVHNADAVIVAVPVAAIAPLVARMAGALRPGTLVSDVGSVKGRVAREVARVLPPGVRYVGTHPIAGTEDSGAGAADPDLFRGTRCIITPTPETEAGAVTQVRALWEGVGASVEELTPERHDEILAWVSHVPHMLAFALMHACPAAALGYAGPSFRGATRVAASDTAMWRDISLYNADAITGALDAVMRGLEALRDDVARGDAEALTAVLAAARAARRSLGDRGA